MTRTRGARNADHDERRTELIGRLHTRLADRALGSPSLRELAAAAGVAVPTLRHYFGGRDDVVAAVLAGKGADGRPHLAVAAQPVGTFAASIRQLLAYTVSGHRLGVGAMHAVGLTEGLGHPAIGPRYVEAILEPTLQAIEARLAAHIAAGQMREADVRTAALGLLAPVLLAQLHQDELGGSMCRPLELPTFVDDHAAAFVRAYAKRPKKIDADPKRAT